MGIIKTLGVALMAVTMLTQTSGAEALQYKSMNRSNGTAAFGAWYEEIEPGVFKDSFVAADQNKSGTIVFYGTCLYDSNTDTGNCWSGEGYFGNSVFSIDRKLNSASLSEVSIEVWDWNAGTSSWVDVAANWSGTGALRRGVDNYMTKFDGFMAKFHGNVSMRDADVTASVDGSDLGSSAWGGLVQYRSMDMSMQR